MSASDKAAPIDPTNEKAPPVHCSCGFNGHAGQLTVEPDERYHPRATLYCPDCGTSAWEFR